MSHYSPYSESENPSLYVLEIFALSQGIVLPKGFLFVFNSARKFEKDLENTSDLHR